MNETRQDAAVMNIVRACGTAAGIAQSAVRIIGLDVPSDAAISFEILSGRNVLSSETCEDMRQMQEFCNVSLRESESLNAKIIASLIQDRLADFEVFAREVERAIFRALGVKQAQGGRTLGLLAGEFAVPDDFSTDSEEINGLFFGDDG